jgi:hypothetical protein
LERLAALAVILRRLALLVAAASMTSRTGKHGYSLSLPMGRPRQHFLDADLGDIQRPSSAHDWQTVAIRFVRRSTSMSLALITKYRGTCPFVSAKYLQPL